ncbi:MAG: cytochrome c biogenesis protein CcdA [Planctomycetota bacterium]
MVAWIENLIRSLANALRPALDAGSPAILPIVFFAGLLSSLLPCVYPVIPITVAFLGAANAPNRARAFLLALSYVLGISATFVAVVAVFFAAKLALSSTVAFGDWNSHPLFALAMGTLYLLLALWMLDVFHFTLSPSRASGPKNPTGLGGAFLVGASAGLVLGPCTGPVLGLIMGVALREAHFVRAVLLVALYALGLGVPFLVIGTFSAMIARRPKPGRWMLVLQRVFAAVILAVGAAFFVRAGQLMERRSTPPAELKVVPPTSVPTVGSDLPEMVLPLVVRTPDGWTPGVWSSKESDKPVVLVFWGSWCVACKEEIPVFSRLARTFAGKVDVIGVDRLESLAPAQLDSFGIDYPVAFDPRDRIADAFGVFATPWLVIADASGAVRYSTTGLPADLEGFVRDLLKESP